MIRFVVLCKQAAVHIHKLIHPQAMRRIKVDGVVVSDSVVESVGGFFALYVAVFAGFMMIAMMDGMDQVTAFGAVAISINNTGPGLGTVAITFSEVSAHGKIVFAFAMLIGRLEIFTFLVLLDAGVLAALTPSPSVGALFAQRASQFRRGRSRRRHAPATARVA